MFYLLILISKTISELNNSCFHGTIVFLDGKRGPRTLSIRLKELEQNKLIIRKHHQNEILPNDEYSITDMRLDLGETKEALNK